MSETSELIQLLNKSHSPFHVVNNLRETVGKGSLAIDETQLSLIKPGLAFNLARNGASFAAVRLPSSTLKAIKIVATHNDSPTFKLKPTPVIGSKGVISLNVEPYGGMIMYSWLDRPLSLAGRLVYERGGAIKSTLLDIDEDLLTIPSLCIHMNRDVNSGHNFNLAKELIPVFGLGEMKEEDFKSYLLEKAGLENATLLSHDLYLYVREEARLVGKEKEFLMSPRLDDLSSAYCAALAFANAKGKDEVAEVFVSFDNEEVGSLTRHGANSTFLKDLIETICDVYGLDPIKRKEVVARSFMFSVDNAHANHPNFPEISDKTTDVKINGGIVIKYNAQQKYTSDGLSSAYAKLIARSAGVEYQEYTNRSDLRGGSTLGNLSNAEISLNAADIGIAQWAMHSSVETQGGKDVAKMVKFLQTFYESDLLPLN